jgi:AcrR family transcriptional regulator
MAREGADGTPRPGKATRPRAPGRPVGKTADQRERLLDAAIACFVRQGISATSLRAIASEGGVTPALLHYYFGDKKQLVDALVEERMLPAFAVVRGRVEAAGDDVADTVAAFVCGVTEAMKTRPWWPQLWVREVLCEGGALRDLLVTRIAPQITRTIADRFAAAQARGEMNADLDPRLLMTSLVGLTLLPAAGAPIWRTLFDADDLGLDDVRRHAIALLDRGLELKGSRT